MQISRINGVLLKTIPACQAAGREVFYSRAVSLGVDSIIIHAFVARVEACYLQRAVGSSYGLL